MPCIYILLLAIFFSETLNWQVLCIKGKYFFKKFKYEKSGFFKINVIDQESVSSKDKQIN